MTQQTQQVQLLQDNNIVDATDVLGFYEESSEEHILELMANIAQWGIDRNITSAGGASSLSQIKKLKEEVQEIEDGLLAGDAVATKDGIGDSLVVIIQICRLSGITLEDALAQAWNSIKDRKGQMNCGVFVKQADSDLVFSHGLQVALASCSSADEVKSVIDQAKKFEDQGKHQS